MADQGLAQRVPLPAPAIPLLTQEALVQMSIFQPVPAPGSVLSMDQPTPVLPAPAPVLSMAQPAPVLPAPGPVLSMAQPAPAQPAPVLSMAQPAPVLSMAQPAPVLSMAQPAPVQQAQIKQAPVIPTPVVVKQAGSPKKAIQYFEWTELGSGAYNEVWKSNFSEPKQLVGGSSHAGPWTLKHPKGGDDWINTAMSEPVRAVRVWNEVNHDDVSAAGLYAIAKTGTYRRGWVAPYIESVKAPTDSQIAQKLIDIYNKTKRIVVDAATEGNFLVDKKTKKVVLVDVDLALKRRNSMSSQNFGETLHKQFAKYWQNPNLQQTRPLTLEVTRNLLFLEDNLSPSDIDGLTLTLKNVLELTWFRKEKKSINSQTFKLISDLVESGITVTDTIRDALILTAFSPKVRDNRTAFFFSPISRKKEGEEVSPQFVQK